MIAHIYSHYNYDQHNARNFRINRAQNSWEYQYRKNGWLKEPIFMGELERNSKDKLGDDRELPFIKDLIDKGFEKSGADTVVLTNNDVGMVKEAHELIGGRTCWSYRINVTKPIRATPELKYALNVGSVGVGVDLISIERKWWDSNRDKYPDLLLGCEGWDWVFRFMIPTSTKSPAVYHEYHEPYWEGKRLKNVGNLWNRSECRKWFDALEFEPGAIKRILKVWPELQLMTPYRDTQEPEKDSGQIGS